MNHLVSFLFCMLLFVTTKGQSSYAEAMHQGDEAFNKQQYKTAINKYFAAEAFDPTKNSVKEKVGKVFSTIETLRKKAQDAFNETEKAKFETLEALNKANKLNDIFYFYKGRFALAAGGKSWDREYFFIDHEGNKITKSGLQV